MDTYSVLPPPRERHKQPAHLSNTSGGTVYLNITAPGTTPTATSLDNRSVAYGTRIARRETTERGQAQIGRNGFFKYFNNLQILVDFSS